MTKLTEESLDFAKEHLEKYYDSDFFPKPFEFEAMWHCWGDVKAFLTASNITKFPAFPPFAMVCSKPNNTYRIVHQLDPVNAVCYTAMACLVAPAVENARLPEASLQACSYRFQLGAGNFFVNNSGYTKYANRTEELAQGNEWVLATDIVDFYNQIYLHRLANAIEYCDHSLKNLGDDIERFVTNVNAKTSQGVPVGPVASIVMSEALMIDIDQFIAQRVPSFTRYVDDIRAFSNDRSALEKLLQELTEYLYEQHRLTLSSEKTTITKADEFVAEQLHNPYAEERVELFESLEIFNPYSGDVEEVEIEVDVDQVLEQRLSDTLASVLRMPRLEIGLARALLRRARGRASPIIAPSLLESLEKFSPVIAEVALYLDRVFQAHGAQHYTTPVAQVVSSDLMNQPLVRYWFEWLTSRHPAFFQDPTINNFISHSAIEHQAQAAVASANIPWVRAMKQRIYQLGDRGRRAVIYSAKVLPSDERKHWLNMTIGSTPNVLDKWVAQWVLES